MKYWTWLTIVVRLSAHGWISWTWKHREYKCTDIYIMSVLTNVIKWHRISALQNMLSTYKISKIIQSHKRVTDNAGNECCLTRWTVGHRCRIWKVIGEGKEWGYTWIQYHSRSKNDSQFYLCPVCQLSLEVPVFVSVFEHKVFRNTAVPGCVPALQKICYWFSLNFLWLYIKRRMGHMIYIYDRRQEPPPLFHLNSTE